MPPWPTRFLSNSSASSTNAPHGNSSSLLSSESIAPQPHPAIADLEYPTLHPSPRSTIVSRSPSRQHARSISHPFPSFFGGSRKGDKRLAGKQDINGLDSTDDEAGQTGDDQRRGSPQNPIPRSSFVPAEKDLITGKCMACDSMVRWPRELKVFRCTICLTINDLEPFPDSKDARAPSGKSETYPGLLVPRKAFPISVERTRAIIDRCIKDYLQSRLNETQPSQRPATHSPPPSPLFSESHDIPEGVLCNQIHDQDQPIRRTPSPLPASTPPLHSSFTTLKASSPSVSRLSPGYFAREGDSSSHASSPIDPARLPAQAMVRRGSSPRLSVASREERPASIHAPADEAVSRPNVRQPPSIFRTLENFVIASFNGSDCINNSFLTIRPQHPARAASEGNQPRPHLEIDEPPPFKTDAPLSEMDAKTLLLGDFAENGSWWTGNRIGRNQSSKEQRRDKSPDHGRGLVNSKTPRINWTEVSEWYHLILHAGESWLDRWLEMKPDENKTTGDSSLAKTWESIPLGELEREISEARFHAHRTLLKATENLLKRPSRPLKHPEDSRFLLILLANPLLYTPSTTRRQPSSSIKDSRSQSREPKPAIQNGAGSPSRRQNSTAVRRSGGPGHHSGIIKRILGLLSNLPQECHYYLVSWFSRFSDSHFQRIVDLVGGFVTYRLTQQHGRKRSEPPKPANGLVPSFSVPGGGTSAQLHAALGVTGSSKSSDGTPKPVLYAEDWQIRAAARVMALLFSANNNHPARKNDTLPPDTSTKSAGLNAKNHAHAHGQLLPISTFYNTLLDYSNLVSDFEAWESRRGKFSFCQYPFFLSIWAKIHIMEYDARRQMEVKAREAFFDSILSRKAVSQFLVLKVRRDCLVEDSLRSVSEVVGSGQEKIKKGLRIEFVGEEGVDAGGLRKEWFLLLVREVFDPNHGLFVYDEDSQFCYFNPYCFESSEQFFLVGVLLGLAIYNSTILDVAFPPFAFKKLLASAPSNNVPATSTPRLTPGYTLEDLAEYRPSLARGLRSLLEFDGDVQETFCRDFVAEVDRYGHIIQIPLCAGGEKRSVTNSNRREFVDLYIQYLLDTAVTRQYDPFKRGFFTVCGGNALSLFRPEEIELLVRGSDEPLDIASLRAVAAYENWSSSSPDSEPAVNWFWEFFENATPKNQRKILGFITGSDRIPAMGATNLIIRVVCIGEDGDRFPTARTCFNMVALYRYSSRERLESKLWRAVTDSEGFGLK